MVLVKLVPRGRVGKMLRAWRGPYKIAKVCQDGRWYILGNGMVAHYERLKPYNVRATELDVEDEKTQDVEEEVEEVPPDLLAEEDTWSDSTYEAESEEDDHKEPEQPAPEIQDRVDGAVRVLRRRARVDYRRMANPKEHILMKIDKADELSQREQGDYEEEGEDQELMRRYQQKYWTEDELNMVSMEEDEVMTTTEERVLVDGMVDMTLEHKEAKLEF